MRARLTALLIHGMGSNPAWWDPFLRPLEELGIESAPLPMPPLQAGGPDRWVAEVLGHAVRGPAILVGHSLGAAVALTAARRRPFEGVVLLAMPPFLDDFSPPAPRVPDLNATVMADVARFLREASRPAPAPPFDIVHFLGGKDAYIPAAQAKRLAFPLVVIPDAGHNLAESPALIRAVVEHLVDAPFGRRHLDPGVRYLHHRDRTRCSPAECLHLTDEAPAPARLDVEVTTRCQLACRFCARSSRPRRAHGDMAMPLFESVLDQAELAEEVIFVGLGEPLLHPRLDEFVKAAAGPA